MSTPDKSRSQEGSSSSAPTKQDDSNDSDTWYEKVDIEKIQEFLAFPNKLKDHENWPCSDIRKYAKHCKPVGKAGVSDIPPCFIAFLEYDIRQYHILTDRTDHISNYVGTQDVNSLHEHWLMTLQKFLITFCRLQRPRNQSSRARNIMDCLGGYDLIGLTKDSPLLPTELITERIAKTNNQPRQKEQNIQQTIQHQPDETPNIQQDQQKNYQQYNNITATHHPNQQQQQPSVSNIQKSKQQFENLNIHQNVNQVLNRPNNLNTEQNQIPMYTNTPRTQNQNYHPYINQLQYPQHPIHNQPHQNTYSTNYHTGQHTQQNFRQNIPSQNNIDQNNIQHNQNRLDQNNNNNNVQYDLSKCITIMTNLFPEKNRPSGEEEEPFMHLLEPIIKQLTYANIPEAHQIGAIISVLKGHAREIATNIHLPYNNVNLFITMLKEKILYDYNICQRKIDNWNNIQLSTFIQSTTSTSKATYACIEHILRHFKDLPDCKRNDQTLHERLRQVFRTEPWCTTLYEKFVPNQTSYEFSNLLKTAASNYDNKKLITSSSTHHTDHMKSAMSTKASDNQQSQEKLVAAFFSKTPPPPNNRRPFRFRKMNRGRWDRRKRYYPRLPYGRNQKPYKPKCYLCRSEGHISTNCPEKEKYTRRLEHIRNVGIAAGEIIAKVNIDFDEDVEEIAAYLEETGTLEEDHEEYPEFQAWICEVLDLTEASTESYFIKESIIDLNQACRELNTYSVFAVLEHLLLDTGAPKTICSIDWLHQANWKSVQDITLPNDIRPFRFAGQPVRPLHASCLVCEITSISGKVYIFRQVVFVLPPTPIPFLVGLQTARKLAFNINLRENDASHLTITKWNDEFNLIVNSHLWLKFKPLNQDPGDKICWSKMISETIKPTNSNANLCFPVHQLDKILDRKARIIPPWEREGWKSNLNQDNITRLHENLRHPKPSAMIELFRRQSMEKQLPKGLIQKITEQGDNCKPCTEHALLPRTPKLAIPPPSMPNIAVTLDVMHHTINGKHIHILVMLDTGDKLLRLSHIIDDTAKTSYNCYFRRWISIFDAPIFTVVDRGTNLAAKYMAEKLNLIQSQLIPIPTEAPWSLGHNERSHRYIYIAIDKIMTADPTTEIENLLSEVEMAWNFSQHADREIPHFNRFGTMPRILGEGNDTTVQQRISLQELIRLETDHIRTSKLIKRAFNPYHRYDKTLRLFSTNQIVWFHRKRFGWRKGMAVSYTHLTLPTTSRV